tara:strand:- start:3434 stop:4027 length:594 start_codon:yes stop_codon:yes gene_type:complete
MNNIPQPVDMSRLKGILGKAKAVMNTVNEGSYQPGNIDSSMITQDTSGYVDNPNEGAQSNIQQQQPSQQTPQFDSSRQPGRITEEALAKSGMPESIKKLMRDNPIVQSNPMMPNSFSLDDVPDLVQPKQTRQPIPKMNENVIKQDDKFTVSEASLRGIIKDVLVEYLAADYSKNLTEGVIKKTINTLIKEGKIKTKR